MLTDLPNILTLSRIVVIPLVVAAFYLNDPWDEWVPFWLYTYACITDFFDGYLARIWKQTSPFGRFLDPIADKLLIATVIVMLVAVGRVDGFNVWAAIVILLREILVSGLREFLAEARVSVPVTFLAKWKTGIQMVALGFLLVGDAGDRLLPGTVTSTTIGEIGLWVAAVLTLYTGWDYLRAGRVHLGV